MGGEVFMATAEECRHALESLTGQLVIIDALMMEWHSLKVARDPHCPVCGAG